MAFKKKKVKLLVALPFVIIFILIANLCDRGVLPAFLQEPIDRLNSATGNLIYIPRESANGLSVHFIDVGQGDCTLVCCDGKNMLIDAGTSENSAKVKNYLRSRGVERLDYVVCTHPHDDHIGGMADVINAFDVGKIIMSDSTTTSRSYENLLYAILNKKKSVTTAKAGDVYRLGSSTFVVLGPEREYDDLNNMSVVIKLTYKNASFLFAGDASEESENDMIAADRNLRADVLKVGHHGSSTAATQNFLNAVNPSFAVISVGLGNPYGLPSVETVKRLKDGGIKTLRTDINGTIVFTSDGTKITCKEEKDSGEFNQTL